MPGGGPHLQIAAICEKVLEDKEGALSLIRIVDQVTQTATGPDPPERMPAFMLDGLTMVVILKADEARGRYAVRLRAEDPSGRQLPSVDTPVQLEGGDRGVNLILQLQFPIELEGTYWFDVLFVAAPNEDRVLTRVPLRVMYQPQAVAPSSAA